MIYFPDMLGDVEFKSSEGGRISDYPADLGRTLERFFSRVSKLPGEHRRITSSTAAQKVARTSNAAARIAKLRYRRGMTVVERFTVWTPQYIHTLDFAEEQGDRNGSGPFWAHIVWVRSIDSLLAVHGIARHSLDTDLRWPTELVPGFEPDGLNSHHNGHGHNPLVWVHHLRPRNLKKQPTRLI